LPRCNSRHSLRHKCREKGDTRKREAKETDDKREEIDIDRDRDRDREIEIERMRMRSEREWERETRKESG
jgi:hypothetical protein